MRVHFFRRIRRGKEWVDILCHKREVFSDFLIPSQPRSAEYPGPSPPLLMNSGSNPYHLQHTPALFVNTQIFSVFGPRTFKLADQMYGNFESLRVAKTTTFSTARLVTRNLRNEMLCNIYVLNLRFWRDRPRRSLHAFLADKSWEKTGCQNFEKLGNFLGSTMRPRFGSSWKTTCAENAF